MSVILQIIGFIALFSAIIIFAFTNIAIIHKPYLVVVFWVAECVAYLFCMWFFKRRTMRDGKKITVTSFMLFFIVLACFIAIIAMSIVRMWQPLITSTLSLVFLILGGVLLLIGSFLQLFGKNKSILSMLSLLLITAVLATGVIWSDTQGFGKVSNTVESHKFLFKNGEGGYATFRIPSLLYIDKDDINDENTKFDDGLFIACAEGRKNSSKDIGEIDIVAKFSSDYGKSWSDLITLFTLEGRVGKFGNPTIVFDRQTKLINFVCMLGFKDKGFDYKTYNYRGKINSDFTITFQEPILINKEYQDGLGKGQGDGVTKNTIMVGSGKGIQLKNGRLIIPASNNGHSFVIYSDDNGITWQKSENAGKGNECEVASLASGQLIMVYRENKAMNLPHPKQFLKFACSDDNGVTWRKKDDANNNLRTPICMSSIATTGENELVVTFPDCFNTRAKLTCAISYDNGKTFKKRKIYDGASGYSCATAGKNNDIFVLAEIGKVEYNEVLMFAQIKN